jgi:hypothetical protein
MVTRLISPSNPVHSPVAIAVDLIHQLPNPELKGAIVRYTTPELGALLVKLP